jgi:isopentenyl diphosphate isomerase/L-lactate dehydrogenase-like FMN-dependent dehydrogenase
MAVGDRPPGASDTFLTIPEVVDAARRRLPPHVWDFSVGGSESETTLRRNRAAFESVAFRPRVLRDVSSVDLATTFLGHPLALPVMVARVGSIMQFDPDGALAVARAADRAGTASFVAGVSSPSLEEVRAGSMGPLVFQLYVRGDRDWLARLVRRVENAGYAALCLTLDSAVYGRRERDLHNRFFPREGKSRPNVEEPPTGPAARPAAEYQAALTWEDVDWLVGASRLPLVLKGIVTPDDATLAVEHGAAVVHVSNHGGRQLDHAPATIEVLPEIVAAVAGRAEVIVDSGFMRGSDVIKALCLGARAVLVGKLMAWGLAAGGVDGLVRTLEILRSEIGVTMAQLGARSVAELGPDLVRPSAPPPPAPWPVTPPSGPTLHDPKE